MKFIKKIFFIFLVLLSFCKKDKTIQPSINYGYNYSPCIIGSYIIYQVDSIAQDDISNKRDTTRYLVKEYFASEFTDLSGRPAFHIERYFKHYKKNVPYDQMPWSASHVWYANLTTPGYEVVEENIRYIKLVFPVKEKIKWNGNLYNTLGVKEYKLDSVDVPLRIGKLAFDSVVVVKHFEDRNFIRYQLEKEKYARNLGLIYKQRDSISMSPHDAGDFPPYKDTVGYFFTQKIISYGME